MGSDHNPYRKTHPLNMLFYVHVGTALYFGWTSVAATVSGMSVLVNDVGLPMDVSCYIGLVILLTLFIIWFSLETFAFDRQLRYIYNIDGNCFFSTVNKGQLCHFKLKNHKILLMFDDGTCIMSFIFI